MESNGMKISFYSGMNIDVLKNHPKDGSSGWIICFIDNWKSCVQSWERESKIESVLNDKTQQKFKSSDIENNFIAIYQVEGTSIEVLLKLVKDKIKRGDLLNNHWLSVLGIEKGAWNLTKKHQWN